MSNVIQEALRNFGLTEKECEVYICLAKNCVQEARTVSKQLRMHKAQVYRILKNLRSKGLVESTFEVPMRFEAVPFKSLLDSMIKTKQKEVNLLEENREILLAQWNSFTVNCPAFHLARFMIVEGRNNLFSMTFKMIERAEKQILITASYSWLIQAAQLGLLDILKKTETEFRLLTTITKENVQKVKPIFETLMKKESANFTVHHVDFVSGIVPCFIIKDYEEAIIFLLPDEEAKVEKEHERGIWTNRSLVFYINSFFEELWQKSTTARELL